MASDEDSGGASEGLSVPESHITPGQLSAHDLWPLQSVQQTCESEHDVAPHGIVPLSPAHMMAGHPPCEQMSVPHVLQQISPKRHVVLPHAGPLELPHAMAMKRPHDTNTKESRKREAMPHDNGIPPRGCSPGAGS